MEREGHPVPDPGPGWRSWHAEVARSGATVVDEEQEAPPSEL
jgi:hypothetical protein